VRKGDGPLVDLYALGVLAFELLDNETPYAGRSVKRVLEDHISAPIPDITARRPDVTA